jgi:hypothetical protein
MATLSRGYDSPACAVFAKECGCDRALTITDSSWGNRIDSGRKIGELLSQTVTERPGQHYREKAGIPEAEFVALGDAGDIPFSSFEDVLAGCTLITGFHGDKVWDPSTPHVGPDMCRGDASGSSMAEFRLRVGFIHVPIPFIGCQQHSDIKAIGQSADLDPWRIGGQYDRPIARRIAEDGGIPRHMFGQRKAAAAIWWNNKRPKAVSYENYKKFRRANSTCRDRAADLIHAPFFWFARGWIFFGRLASRVLRRLGIHMRIPRIVPVRFLEPAGETQLVQWGISIVRQRYEFHPDE